MQFIIERNRKENIIVNYIFSWFILDIQGRIVQIDSHQVQEDGKFTAFAATTIIFFLFPNSYEPFHIQNTEVATDRNTIIVTSIHFYPAKSAVY